MAYCKTVVTPLLVYWRYNSIALSSPYDQYQEQFSFLILWAEDIVPYGRPDEIGTLHNIPWTVSFHETESFSGSQKSSVKFCLVKNI